MEEGMSTMDSIEERYEAEIAKLKEKIERLRCLASIAVANAVIGPDVSMSGTTDCYHVPHDDIEALKAETERQNEGRKIYEIFFRDLKPEAQKNLCKIFKTTEKAENWDVFPLCTLERENGEAS
jgi:uncharacterized small protein (DUF1192 family)